MNRIACIIPAYNEEAFIEGVLTSVPDYVQHIVVINDAITDATAEIVKRVPDPRIHLISHATNQGVGGAVVSGYREALKLGADIVVKIDGDGQMDARQIKRLIAPIENGNADYAKGVRFRDASVIKTMPVLRLIGNLGLSFLTKAASGYWNILDPTNGFTAIERRALRQLDLDRLNKGFFLETDMLIHLYLLDAVVVDVPFTARYGDEKSHMSLLKTLFTFPFYLFRGTVRRIFVRYFVRDFTAFSIFLIFGSLLFSVGTIMGAVKWIEVFRTAEATPTGTVVFVALLIILGFQLLLQAAVLDINNVPTEPIQRWNGDDEPEAAYQPLHTARADAIDPVPADSRREESPTLQR